MTALNRQQARYLDKPSLKSDVCAVCGRKAANDHHVIVKGLGGVSKELEKRIPTISLCGMGNVTGCHGAAHKHRIEFEYDDDRELWLWRRKGCSAWHACFGQERWTTFGAKR